MENAEKKICRPDSHSDGPCDGVMLKAECIRTDFIDNPEGEGTVFQQRDKSEASISASMELGTFSIRDRESGVMLTVLFQDAMEVMTEALRIAKEVGTCITAASENAETPEESGL